MTLDTDAFYKEIGWRVKKVRMARNMTQEALARRIGMRRTSVTNIEKGEQKFLVHTLVEIAQVLRVPPMELLPQQYESREKEIDAVLKDTPADAQQWIKSLVGGERKEAHDGGSA